MAGDGAVDSGVNAIAAFAEMTKRGRVLKAYFATGGLFPYAGGEGLRGEGQKVVETSPESR